jgi:sensor histidine kinase YesM
MKMSWNYRVVKWSITLVYTLLSLYNAMYFSQPLTGQRIGLMVFQLALIAGTVEASGALLTWLYKRLNEHMSTGWRLFTAFLCAYLLTVLIRALSYYVRGALFGTPLPKLRMLLTGFVIMSYWLSLSVVVIHELFYVSALARKVEEESEALSRAGLQRQFDSLREQVNPHFLFNNLNSLITLIAKDRDKADEFIEEMSLVYRYLLRNNRGNLTSLREELRFIESYNHLLRTRFGEGFQPEISVSRTALDLQLPPMTLQLLVENAVKHNVVSLQSPLLLQIAVIDGSLVVTNNIQRKSKSAPSTQVGLQNIRSRYSLLRQPDIRIEDDGSQFTVIVPLINNEMKPAI